MKRGGKELLKFKIYDNKKKIELSRENWIKASLSLSFKVITPYYIEINGIKKEVFAFLPEYGRPNGVIICLTSPPDFEVDHEIVNWANEKNFCYSFINVENIIKYEKDYFKEFIKDWL